MDEGDIEVDISVLHAMILGFILGAVQSYVLGVNFWVGGFIGALVVGVVPILGVIPILGPVLAYFADKWIFNVTGFPTLSWVLFLSIGLAVFNTIVVLFLLLAIFGD